MSLKINDSSHCLNVERVYDWVHAPLQCSVFVDIPLVKKAAKDEVCGNFTLFSPGQVSRLWESILPFNVSGSVTILMTSGSLASVDILINGKAIDTNQESVYNKTFHSLKSIEIRNKDSLLPVTGKYCFTIHYFVIQDRQESICDCQFNRCFLANECGEPVDLDELICKEAGAREQINISFPDGKDAVLEKVTLCKQGFIGVCLNGRTQVCVIPFSKVEHLILCAPEGTSIHCQVTHFSCRINTITRCNNCLRLEFIIDICQSIQSVANVTVEINDGISCSPRNNVGNATCMNSKLIAPAEFLNNEEE